MLAMLPCHGSGESILKALCIPLPQRREWQHVPTAPVLTGSISRAYCRVLVVLCDINQPLQADGFAPGCNCLVVMQEAMKVGIC